ncbi:DNA-binding transcriptional regulator [Telmatospirillum sp. J64-1]|uniref:helix-turn-helix domain-containing protein n=1 Tax=Telmatospirillum sp. J64-1 TaxID=2502183 RepID=UPI00115F094A|nr:transcriptional regulator [Telmatospirillum sp. J64-1]
MYHYTECGLENVWLVNGYREIETGYGKAVSVPNSRALHQAIATDLIHRKPHLSGGELRFLRGNMDKTQAEFAYLLGRDTQTVARWEKSEEVPDLVNVLARVIYLNHLGETPSYLDMVYKVADLKKGETPAFTYQEKEENWEFQEAA